jgi:Aminoacyl-tRNA editing domain
VELHPTAARLQERLVELGLDVRVQELEASTRTAEEAAAAVGAEIGQIVKSLVFVADGAAVLVLCAGDRRVDPARLASDARQARADEVREATGSRSAGSRRSATTGRCGRWSTRRSGASRRSGAPPGRRGACSRSARSG